MSDSFELRDEIQSLREPETYNIRNEHDPTNEDPERLLEGAVEAVAESSDAIADPDVFNIYCSLLKHSEAVPGLVMSKLLDSLSSGFQAELDATIRDIEQEEAQVYMAHRQPLERYAFLLQWFVSAAEKVKGSDNEDAGPATPLPKARRGRGGKSAGAGKSGRSAASKKTESWTWVDQIPAILNLICRVLRLSTPRIWTTTAERDTFISCITRPAYHITENEQYMKSNEIRLSVCKVICLAVKHHGHSLAAQITIMQSLQFYEHMSEPMAQCLSILAKEFDHAQLGDEVLREIAGKNFSGQDNKGPRHFSKFLISFAEQSPRSLLKQLSLLTGQLDSDAYPMRIAIVEVLGALIKELGDAPDGTATDAQVSKQVGSLYELLLDRIMDLSSYVRVRVLAVLSKLCDMKPKWPKHRLAVTRAAVGALEDKVASVRKGAAALLVKLLVTHPYLTNGGILTYDVWQKEYDECTAKLAQMQGPLGNIEGQGGEEEQDAAEDEEEEDEEGEGEGEEGGEESESRRTKKKGKRTKRRHGEDEMDVDADEEEEGSGNSDADENGPNMSVDGDTAETPAANKKKSKKSKNKGKPRQSQVDLAALSTEQAAVAALDHKEVILLTMQKKYCAEALDFIRQIRTAMETMAQLLGSTHKPEVLEAMEFFRVAHEYRLEEAKVGLKKMLHLIWAKDNTSVNSEDGKELKGVRSRLLECYRALYFEPVPDLDSKGNILRVAKNMIEQTFDATLADLTSLEEMMRIMMLEDRIQPGVIAKLWEIYSLKRSLPRTQRRGAIIILGMLALAKRSILTDQVDTMLQIGLGVKGKSDLTLARYTCLALQRLNGSSKKTKGSLLDKTLRMEMENPIFRRLQETVEQPCRSKDWFGLAEQAINTVYALGEHPDVLCNQLIKNLAIKAFTPRSKSASAPQTRPQEQTEKDPDLMDEDHVGDVSRASNDTTNNHDSASEEKDLGDAFELSQLLFVVGHVAIKHVVYLELVEREWKRQKDEKQTAEKQTASRTSKEHEELDQVAGNAEDEIGERIAAIRETELLYGAESLLAVFGPMLVHVCGSPHKFKNRTLRAAATLSLSKFLCVSSQFCDQHHALLFKILEISKDANIRSNIVVALGDVAVSFSNIIDENSNELYRGLSDRDLVVKKNTLMVLTHLILNGMIKVKGQLGEMAKCLEDEDPRIADLAKLFFSELSTKDNAIYNNLPDVISHLGTGEHAVDEETFQRTLRYIFTFIEKEKQAESIVDKLCQRFRLSEDPRQWRDIAFCLSLLPFKSERSVKKLIDGLQFYRDKLHEKVVYERFTEILAKARQNKSPNKPDSELNEFEQILEEHKLQGEEDQALEKRAKGKKAAAKKRASKKATRKKAAPVEEADSE